MFRVTEIDVQMLTGDPKFVPLPPPEQPCQRNHYQTGYHAAWQDHVGKDIGVRIGDQAKQIEDQTDNHQGNADSSKRYTQQTEGRSPHSTDDITPRVTIFTSISRDIWII